MNDLIRKPLQYIVITVLLVLSTCLRRTGHVLLDLLIQIVKDPSPNVGLDHLLNVLFVVREIDQTLGDLGLVLYIMIRFHLTPSSKYRRSNLMISVSLKSNLFLTVEVYDKTMSRAWFLVFRVVRTKKDYIFGVHVLNDNLDLLCVTLLNHLY